MAIRRTTNTSASPFNNALKIISAPMTLYVSPNGSDTENSGLVSGSPFQTIQAAYDYLADKYITNEGFVTIKLSSGVHTVYTTVIVSHQQGDRIAICGEAPDEATLKQVTSYEGATYTEGDFDSYTRDIGCIIVVAGVTAGSFVETHGFTGITGSGIVFRNESMAGGSYASTRNRYASNTPNAAKMAAILGAHTVSGETLGSITVTSNVKNQPFRLRAENVAPGTNEWLHQFGGDSSNLLCGDTKIILPADPTGYYGDINTVGRTATTAAVFTGQTGSYLYNVQSPSSTQITNEEISATILPTVIRFNGSSGSVLRFENSGVHGIKNVFFDGVTFNGFDTSPADIKVAIELKTSTIGKDVINTPSSTLIASDGMENVGVTNFIYGIRASDGSLANIGSAAISNCLVGVAAFNNTTVESNGLILTGCEYAGFLASNNSIAEADACFCGIGGFSTNLIQFSPYQITATSFTKGDSVLQQQTDGTKVYGKVLNWDSFQGLLLVGQVFGVAEASASFDEEVAITGGVSGDYSASSTFAQSSILSVNPSSFGVGFLAMNNSTISAKNSVSVFNKHANFLAVNNSSIKAFASVSCAAGHAGFLSSGNSNIDASAALSCLAPFPFRAESGSQMICNSAIAINGYKHNFHANGESNISAVGYESRMGTLGQTEFHHFAADSSRINNLRPTYTEDSVTVDGTTFDAVLVAPTNNTEQRYSTIV